VLDALRGASSSGEAFTFSSSIGDAELLVCSDGEHSNGGVSFQRKAGSVELFAQLSASSLTSSLFDWELSVANPQPQVSTRLSLSSTEQPSLELRSHGLSVRLSSCGLLRFTSDSPACLRLHVDAARRRRSRMEGSLGSLCFAVPLDSAPSLEFSRSAGGGKATCRLMFARCRASLDWAAPQKSSLTAAYDDEGLRLSCQHCFSSGLVLAASAGSDHALVALST
jgi:hypothetical protein